MACATGSGRWMCRRWPTPSIVRSSTSGTDERRNAATSTHSGLRVAPEDRQHRALDGGGLLGPERPLGEAGQLDAEERVDVLEACSTAPGMRSSSSRWHATQSSPLTALRNIASASSCSPLRVGVEHRAGALEERRAAGHREQRELQQDQGRHPVRVVEGQLRGDGRSAGVAATWARAMPR